MIIVLERTNVISSRLELEVTNVSRGLEKLSSNEQYPLDLTRSRDESRLDAKMSKAVTVGGLVFLSGQVAHHTQGQGIREQTNEVLKIIEQILLSSSSSKDRILHATVHLTKEASFSGMNEAWNEFIGDGHEPARTTVEASLYAPDCLIEITVVAALTE